MLARTNILKHPSGIEIQTPLLISSFSSKGFRFIGKETKLRSESIELLKQTSEYLSETVLLSTYDLNYYFPEIKKLRDFRFFPKIVFLDSGGYETLEDYDFSEAYKHPIIKKDWTSEMHSNILKQWPEYYPGIIVSYDNGNEKRITLSNQIDKANKLFQNYPNQLNDFLIKPEKKGNRLDIKLIIDNISLLRKFNIIGMTEKELGESIVDRMHNIKTIRLALDKIDCKAPIHIFGNLDPFTSVLYFIAGAEIFDGLTWLRFAFHEGRSIYLQNFDAVKNRIHEKDYLNYRTSLVENLIYMRNLQSEMKSFVKAFNESPDEKAFSHFRFISEEAISAWKAMNSK
jgi:hypothetical protein